MNLIFRAFLLFNLFGFTALHNLKIGNNFNVVRNSYTSLELVGPRSITPKKDQALVIYSPHHITKRSSDFDIGVRVLTSIGSAKSSIFGPIGTAIGGVPG